VDEHRSEHGEEREVGRHQAEDQDEVLDLGLRQGGLVDEDQDVDGNQGDGDRRPGPGRNHVLQWDHDEYR
jgi:hypothetical protein